MVILKKIVFTMCYVPFYVVFILHPKTLLKGVSQFGPAKSKNQFLVLYA
jgi:hypothetical protein